jgi:hypothetical protein
MHFVGTHALVGELLGAACRHDSETGRVNRPGPIEGGIVIERNSRVLLRLFLVCGRDDGLGEILEPSLSI